MKNLRYKIVSMLDVEVRTHTHIYTIDIVLNNIFIAVMEKNSISLWNA